MHVLASVRAASPRKLARVWGRTTFVLLLHLTAFISIRYAFQLW
jgi:hypothetical protein